MDNKKHVKPSPNRQTRPVVSEPASFKPATAEGLLTPPSTARPDPSIQNADKLNTVRGNTTNDIRDPHHGLKYYDARSDVSSDDDHHTKDKKVTFSTTGSKPSAGTGQQQTPAETKNTLKPPAPDFEQRKIHRRSHRSTSNRRSRSSSRSRSNSRHVAAPKIAAAAATMPEKIVEAVSSLFKHPPTSVENEKNPHKTDGEKSRSTSRKANANSFHQTAREPQYHGASLSEQKFDRLHHPIAKDPYGAAADAAAAAVFGGHQPHLPGKEREHSAQRNREAIQSCFQLGTTNQQASMVHKHLINAALPPLGSQLQSQQPQIPADVVAVPTITYEGANSPLGYDSSMTLIQGADPSSSTAAVSGSQAQLPQQVVSVVCYQDLERMRSAGRQAMHELAQDRSRSVLMVHDTHPDISDMYSATTRAKHAVAEGGVGSEVATRPASLLTNRPSFDTLVARVKEIGCAKLIHQSYYALSDSQPMRVNIKAYDSFAMFRKLWNWNSVKRRAREFKREQDKQTAAVRVGTRATVAKQKAAAKKKPVICYTTLLPGDRLGIMLKQEPSSDRVLFVNFGFLWPNETIGDELWKPKIPAGAENSAQQQGSYITIIPDPKVYKIQPTRLPSANSAPQPQSGHQPANSRSVSQRRDNENPSSRRQANNNRRVDDSDFDIISESEVAEANRAAASSGQTNRVPATVQQQQQQQRLQPPQPRYQQQSRDPSPQRAGSTGNNVANPSWRQDQRAASAQRRENNSRQRHKSQQRQEEAARHGQQQSGRSEKVRA